MADLGGCGLRAALDQNMKSCKPNSSMFLRDLTEHATQREFVYSHAWQPHDLIMWDNRATMHRARRFDRNEVRDVRRTTLAGDMPTIEQAV
jgi:alpha-ketoglutarate-dependent 2,4-dichlorophenoxyacetate dioxygenase